MQSQLLDPFGIDTAVVQRLADAWPEAIVVRAHLSGLESFEFDNGKEAVSVSVASTGNHRTSAFLRRNGQATRIGEDSAFWTVPKMVGGNGRIPLRGGYFEVPLPASLLRDNPAHVQLRWVDLFRV